MAFFPKKYSETALKVINLVNYMEHVALILKFCL